MANFEAVYGSLSSITVLFLWFFVSALVLLLGAEYNIVRWQARSRDARPDNESGRHMGARSLLAD